MGIGPALEALHRELPEPCQRRDHVSLAQDRQNGRSGRRPPALPEMDDSADACHETSSANNKTPPLRERARVPLSRAPPVLGGHRSRARGNRGW